MRNLNIKNLDPEKQSRAAPAQSALIISRRNAKLFPCKEAQFGSVLL
jgi:hypothetical protein